METWIKTLTFEDILIQAQTNMQKPIKNTNYLSKSKLKIQTTYQNGNLNSYYSTYEQLYSK